MKKKLWTLALAFCLVSAMLPGGVFHAERAWAADTPSVTASTVSIAGKTLDGTNKYYYNGTNGGVGKVTDTKDKGEPNATFEASTGILTLNGLNLNLEADKNIQGIVASGDLTIKLIGTNSITQNGTSNAICAWSGLTISGTGTLVTASNTNNTNEVNTLIYANGNININGGAKITAITARSAQAINANAGNIEIAGEGTSVKAVNENTWNGNSDAIRVNSGNGTGNGTVTISDGATLEAETKSSSAKAINGTVNATGYTGKIKAGESKAMAIAWTDSSAAALNTYKYVRIGEEEPNYLTFTAEVDNSSVTLNYESGTDVQYKQYTKTSNTWGEWTTYTAGTAIPLAKDEQVSFKGKDVKTNLQKHFSMTGKIAASGSVTSLTDENGNDPDVRLQNECYKYMFYDCKILTTAPTLPAKSLANDCYDGMFYECENLTTAPILPAVNIPSGAYASMFFGCTSLTAAPELPATSIDNGSYYHMFYGCTNLTTPPSNLPATILKEKCYFGMFSGCKKLKSVPQIKATQLPKYCFNYMFDGCSNLSIRKTQDDKHTIAWSINATTSEDESFWNDKMFDNLSTLDFPVKTNRFDNKQHKAPELNTIYYVNPNGANSGGTTPTVKTIIKPTLEQSTFTYQGTNITPTLQFTNTDDKEHVTIEDDTSKKNVGNYTIKVTPIPGYTWVGGSRATLPFSWSITQAGNIHVNVGNMTAYVDDTTLPQHKYTITGLLGEDQNQASVIFAYHRIDAAGNAETKESVPDLTREGKYRIDVLGLTIAEAGYTQNYTDLNYTSGKLEIVKKDSTPSGSSGGGYVAPSTDVKTSGSADSKVTSSPSTVQNETRTDASGKQETVAKVTVSAANQREILSQAKANKSKRIIIQIAKTAVQGDAKLELNLDKTFVQSILHDTEASLTIRTADGDRVIAREALKTLVAQTEGNTVVIDPAAQENPTDPVAPSKAETLAALDSSRLVARSKLVTLKNGKKGIRITWIDKNGAEMNFDGVEIYRSTKKNRFGKKPFYATKGGKSAGYYINSKGIRSGVTYYYKVRGYVLIDGQKHYTDLSLKAIRTVK